MTSRSSPMRASNSARKASMAAGSPRSMPAPQAWAVSRQKPSRWRGTPARVGGVGDGGQLLDVRAQAPAATGRVLEHEHRARRGRRRPRRGVRRMPSATRATPASTPVPRWDPMWTLTKRAPNDGRAAQLAGEDVDGRGEEGPGPARPGCTGTRHGWRPAAMPCTPSRSTKASQLDRRLGPATPRRRVVGPDLERVGADLVRRGRRPDHARGQRQVGAERRWSGGIRGIVRCGPWMTRSTADEALTAKTIRAFIRDGRLTTIPAREKRRLDHLPLPARPGLHRGPRLPRGRGQPAPGAVPPGRRDHPARHGRRGPGHPRGRRVPARVD